ncbi:nucleotidyltransferase substrate binding protein, HI0074 family [Belliella buryatensis]|uniref:Nucleotidyltransferase substrate binding protein, HI0074 family n=1 Tax=Belliella buryatensis TaxID=1500549 RepID=A0A239FCW2_9BACT|nr:nucleotidyltransferase substrate binding protein [Belliella buryatensis]SNS54769.1 nucleotidyltransferase substrate binding protein, HI0074 family [Belliella buryatensis]
MKSPTLTCEKCLLDFQDALEQLKLFVQSGKSKGLDARTEAQLVRSFELAHELALKTITEFFRQQKHQGTFSGSRDITVEAFNEDLIDDGKGWMDMIILRIKYNPIYPESAQNELVSRILKDFISLFENFNRKMTARLEN